jgi:HEAT repeat protein
LNNEESCYQESAVISLGKIGTEAVVPALIQALKNHRSHTGEAAASALGKIGTEAVVSAADSQCFRRNGY